MDPQTFDCNAKELSASLKVQLLPAKIHFDGEAPVTAYFVQDESPSKGPRTSFRGRGLIGHELEMPFGFHLAVLERKRNVEKSEDRWALKGKTNSLLVWAHDEVPSELNSSVMNLPHWVELASTLHQPILDESE